MEHFGKAMRRQRARMHITQKQLSSRIGCSQPMVSRLETQPEPPDKIDTLVSIQRELDIDISPWLKTARTRQAQNGRSFFIFRCPCCVTNGQAKTYEVDPKRHDDINFCGVCGSNLIKECSACDENLSLKEHDYCGYCGNAYPKGGE